MNNNGTDIATHKRFGWKKTVAYSLIPVVVLFVLLEVAARVIEIWVPPMKVDYGQGFDPGSRLFISAPDDPLRIVTNPVKETSFRKQQFETVKPPRTLRVFALGESSVNYLDYEFPLLEKRLQQALKEKYDRVEIVNCGGLSYGSHRLVPIAAEIMQYAPDLVMVYLGHNEFEEVEQLDLAGMKTLPLQRTLGRSALWRFLRDRVAGWRIGKLEEQHNRRLLAQSAPDTSKNWMHEFTPKDVSERMEKFRDNYGLIISMCADNRVPIVIGTVPSNLFRPLFPKEGIEHYREVLDLFDKGEYEKGAARGREILKSSLRHQSSDLENDVIRALAGKFGVPLADVEKAVIEAEPHRVPGETLFNDHCHLNPKGNEILIKTYEEQILKILR